MASTTMSLGDINNDKISKPLNGTISNIDLFESKFSIPADLQNLIINSHIIEESCIEDKTLMCQVGAELW